MQFISFLTFIYALGKFFGTAPPPGSIPNSDFRKGIAAGTSKLLRNDRCYS